MMVEQVQAELKQWLKLAVSLEEELEQPEPDGRLIATLLTERGRVQQRLVQLFKDVPAETLRGRPELRELAEAILASDRHSMELAGSVRAECVKKLEEVRKRREMASGYRRTLRSAMGDGPAFYDARI